MTLCMLNKYLETLSEIINSGTSIKLHADKVQQLRFEMEELRLLSDDDRVMISNRIRSKVQREAEEALGANNCWGAVIMATGTGKSKVGVDVSSKLTDVKFNPKMLLAVPTEKLRDENWKEEYQKWGKGDIYDKLVRTCYASLNKFEDEEFELVMLDEGHNITEENSQFFKKNKVNHVVLFTATEPRNFIKKEILKNLGIHPVYELTVDEAVKLGLVAPYDITVITTHLNNVDKYIESGNKKSRFYQTEKEKYTYLSKLCASRPGKVNYLKRMRFIYNLRSKTEAAKAILENVIPKDYRTLIFCGSIDQADQLCVNSFHSKTDDWSFNMFKEGVVDKLSCVDALNEGHNISDLDCAFIVQTNSSDLDLIQRIGRVIRFRPGHQAKIIILCTEDTVDLSWIKKATAKLNASNIRFVELARLRMGVETISFD